MGDVFDAMKRARDERGGDGERDDPASDQNPADAAARDASEPQLETSGLPTDEVQPPETDPRPQTQISAPAPTDRAVSSATEKSRSEQGSKGHPWVDASDPASNGYSSEIITHHDRGSPITEQYRAIRTQILARGRNRRLQVTTLTSAAPDEGKSVTTINLGVAFSELRNQKSLLIEGDLRRPAFARLLCRDATPGLSQLLKGEIDELESVIHDSVYDNLQILPAGASDSVSSTELLSSPRMVQLLDRLRDRYDHIFIDTPPVMNVTDASILGAMSDQTILIVRLKKTPGDVVERTKRLLRAANCEVAGIVLTHQAHATPKYLYRYYGY